MKEANLDDVLKIAFIDPSDGGDFTALSIIRGRGDGIASQFFDLVKRIENNPSLLSTILDKVTELEKRVSSLEVKRPSSWSEEEAVKLSMKVETVSRRLGIYEATFYSEDNPSSFVRVRIDPMSPLSCYVVSTSKECSQTVLSILQLRAMKKIQESFRKDFDK